MTVSVSTESNLVERPGEETKVPSTLQGKAADIWRGAFDGAYSGTCADREDKDACAAKVAWGAVKDKFKKNEDGEWIAKVDKDEEEKKRRGMKYRQTVGTDSPMGDTASANQPLAIEPDRPIIPTPQNLTRAEAEVWNSVYLEAVKGECGGQENPQACAAREAWNAVKAFGEEAVEDDDLVEIDAEVEVEAEEGDVEAEADAEDEAEAEEGDDEELGDDELEAEDEEAKADKDAEAESDKDAEADEESEPEDEEDGDKKRKRKMNRKSTSSDLPKEVRMSPSEYNERQMQGLIAAGRALPDGRCPIVNKADVVDAADAFVQLGAGDAELLRHIIVRAGSLGVLDTLPELWLNGATIPWLSQVDDKWLDATVERVLETVGDLAWLERIGEDTKINRPAHIASTKWASLPAIERTARAEFLRRLVKRRYSQAVDDMRIGGWEAKSIQTRDHELEFKRWLDHEEGPLLQRAILVRKIGSKDWKPREVSRGASLSTAVATRPDEIRA